MDGLQHLYAPPAGLALGKVTDTADPQSRGRVKVTLLAANMDVWAPCVVPSSGRNYGAAAATYPLVFQSPRTTIARTTTRTIILI
jgi:hypothetical protein